MSGDTSRIVVPVRFAGQELLIEATSTTILGTERTSAPEKLADIYERAETTILKLAAAIANTLSKMAEQAKQPKQVEVEFGLGVSFEGDVLVIKGASEATLAIRLTYDITKS